MDIQGKVNEFNEMWCNTSTAFPLVGAEISLEEKKKRELVMLDFSEKINTNIDTKKLSLTGRKQLKLQMKQNLMAFFKNCFNFNLDEIEIVAEKGFMNETNKFMRMARAFDPEVKIEDIFQANRNLWIVNSLQIMMGAEIKVSPSTFAYSMLYPYSDNYLDNPNITIEEKIGFSNRFRSKLEGKHPVPINSHENKIFNLVELIESEWDRVKFPQVFDSLLAIHHAQTKSIYLLKGKANLNEQELMDICIEKGGTSVLADGYLINGNLTPAQETFCFGFGVFLQFVDDIQDLQEDMDGDLDTIFTYAAQTNQLAAYTNRAIAFTNKVIGDLSCFESETLETMKSLMQKSIYFMMNEAVGINRRYYSLEYSKSFESHSPFSYDFVRERRKKMSSKQISLMKKLEAFIFASDHVQEMAFG